MSTLLGLWMIDPSTKPDQVTTIEFKNEHQLIYSILKENSKDLILLNYYIEDDMIITDQPSNPKIEKTKFKITLDNKIILTFDSKISQYIRVPDME